MGMIVLEDIEVMARIGLLEEELYAPQDLTVSVEIEHSFDRISETDDLADGVDYREVIEFFFHQTNHTPSNASTSLYRYFASAKFLFLQSVGLPGTLGKNNPRTLPSRQDRGGIILGILPFPSLLQSGHLLGNSDHKNPLLSNF